MRSFLILCLVGLAVSFPGEGGSGTGGPGGRGGQEPGFNGIGWQSGREYVFDYSGRLMTGLPELSTQYSGIGIKCKVHVSVQSFEPRGRMRFGLKLTEVKYVRINDKLTPDQGPESEGRSQQNNENWRNLPLGQYEDLPSDYAQILSNPAQVTLLSNGEFETMVVAEQEPEWSINMKKALTSLFQTRFSESSVNGQVNSLETNALGGGSSPSGSGSEEQTVSWTGTEMSLDGTCQVIYQLHELPSYMIRDYHTGQPEQWIRNCPSGSRYYELVKSRDVSSCTKHTSFSFYKPGVYKCGTGNCAGMWSRSSITRYHACGTERDSIKIQTIVNEGELSQNLLGFKTEKFITGTKQILKLIETRSGVSGMEGPRGGEGSQVLRTLYYEYGSTSSGGIQGSGVGGGVSGSEEWDSMVEGGVSLPRHMLTTGSGKKFGPTSGDKSQIIEQIKRNLNEIINRDLLDLVTLPKKQITMKTLTISRGVSLLTKSEIESVYSDLKNQLGGEQQKLQTLKNLWFDIVTVSGTHESIKFMKEKISQGEVSKTQTLSFFMFLPTYVLSPTQTTLNTLYELITNEQRIKSSPILRHQSIMSMTVLVQRACISDNRKTSYPTFVWGEFCSPDSRIVVQKWLPYLETILRNPETSQELRNVIIVSLGHLSHKNVIPIILPYVESPNQGPTPSVGRHVLEEGSSGSQLETSRLTRVLAIYALGQPGRTNPQLVNPELIAVFGNPSENTEVRIAALNVILKNNPPMATIQQIGTSTWYERDTEVLKAVNSAFFTLSRQYDVNPLSPTYDSLPRKVYLVYPMIKKTGGRFPTSSLIFGGEELNRLGVGYQYLTSWTGSKESVLPTGLYSKLVYFLDQYQFNPMEIGLRLRNGETLVNQLVEILSNGQIKKGGEEFIEKVKSGLHQEWRQVIDQLRIKTRGESSESEATFYMNLFEDSPLFASVQTTSTEMLKEKIAYMLGSGRSGQGIKQGLKDKICGQSEVNFQRIHDLTPTEISIPSDMGFPILIELHLPVMASTRGSINVDCSQTLPKINMKVHTIFASQLTGWVGTICPFTKQMVVTGVDEHAVMNMPVEFDVELDLEQQKLNVEMTPLPQIRQSSTPIDIFHFHVRPYTVAQSYFDLTPMTLSQGVKFISAKLQQLKTRSWSFGEMLGLNLRSVISTESPFLDFRSVIEKLRMYNWNPMNVLRFGWFNTALTEGRHASLRKHELQLKYNPGQSTTRSIKISINLQTLTKTKGESSPIKVHKLKPNHGPSGSVWPVKVESKPVSGGNPELMKLKGLLERSGVENGSGVGVKVNVILSGSRTRTFTYGMNLVTGQEGMFKSKWNVHLESGSSDKKVCVNGEVTSPILPSWKIEELQSTNVEFRYKNEIGFGSQCTESKLIVTGTAKTSEKQKQWSRTSPEAKLLEKMKAKNVPLTKVSKVSEKVRMQATTLDEVDFRVQYENVPQIVMTGSNYVVEAVKAWLWPYIVHPSGSHGGIGGGHSGGGIIPGSGPVTATNFWNFKICPVTRTFTLIISRPSREGVIEFQHVHIPYPLDMVVPMNAYVSPAKVGSLRLLGQDLYPVCSLERQGEQDWINTYDNRTTKSHIDDCYHVLSSDCSGNKDFLVLVKGKTSSKSSPLVLKTFIAGKTEIIFKPSGQHSRYQSDVEVFVNGTKINFESSHRSVRQHTIIDSNGQRLGEITQDSSATRINSRWLNVVYDTRAVQVIPSNFHKDKLCGLCGDFNGQKLADLRGPKKCVFSKPEYVSASYRVPGLSGEHCSPLPQHVEQGLRREEQECAKYAEIPTQVVGSFKAKTGPCTRHQHEIIERPSELCFSRRPVVDCSPRCQPTPGSVVPKNVSFTCMIKNRTAYHYAEKVRQGQTVPELANLPESFSLELPLPRSCQPVNPLV